MTDERATVAYALISGVLGCSPEDVTAQTPVGALPQWDSIAHISIILAFEEKLGRQMTSDEIGALATVADLAALLPPARR